MTGDSLIRYPVTYTEAPQEVAFLLSTDGDSLANDIVLELETEYELKLTVTGSQYTKLLSAAMNGAYRFWPNETLDIIWPLIKAGKEYAMSCEQVAECIETSVETQDALADVILNNETVYNAILEKIKQSGVNTPQGQIDVNNDTVNSIGQVENDMAIGVIEDCNNDKLWGAIRYGVVAYLEDNALNFLEDLNTIADKGQRASRLVSGIPIVGDMLSATVSEFAEVIPDLLNLFNSYASETVRDNIACELFQIGCNDCVLPTYGDLIGYYSAFGVTGFDDIEDMAFQLATDLLVGTSTLTGSIVYHTIIAYELAILYVGARFNQALGFKMLDIWADIGEDFASDNWEILCGGCGDTGIYEYDFTVSDCNFLLSGAGRGAYVAGVGWRSTNDGSQTGVWIYKDVSSCVIGKIEVEYELSANTWRKAVINRNDVNSSTGQYTVWDYTNGVTPDTHCVGITEAQNRNNMLVFCNKTVVTSDTITIKKIRLNIASGTPPSGYTSSGVTMSC